MPDFVRFLETADIKKGERPMQDDALPSPLQSPLLTSASPSIAHGFFTRKGGVSKGIYKGLNVGLGSKDDRAHVEENRTRVAAWFSRSAAKLATVHQIHSPDVVIIGDDYDGTRSEADALVTTTPGIVLGVLSADCGPILFADPQARVVGAAHAGWKGALTGVLENTISAMINLGSTRENIIACLGPSIGPDNYEVGPEFVERFLARNEAYASFFTPAERPGHAMFDLPGLTVARLLAAGIKAEKLGLCTYEDEARFFSYRRTTHRGEPDYGRQISAISIREA